MASPHLHAFWPAMVTPSLFQKFPKLLHIYCRTILLLIDIAPSKKVEWTSKKLGNIHTIVVVPGTCHITSIYLIYFETD
ncbi:hypothetical protein Tsubulata_003631 [Turnera subulata]|uniref:Uncharacterized protein n=1 Tax=Turnera subulata TaxID=218843 RepID=A0A9Q0FF10_9ROSI|nr:hypothetical protein Tsubulata_003631 [Turnera subulata]